MSTNKDNEETLRQLESRLQKLESQRKLEEYAKEEQKGKERKATAYAMIGTAIILTFACFMTSMSVHNFGSVGSIPIFFLVICILLLLIAGLSQLNK